MRQDAGGRGRAAPARRSLLRALLRRPTCCCRRLPLRHPSLPVELEQDVLLKENGRISDCGCSFRAANFPLFNPFAIYAC
jgi:hypothetical protein